MMLDEGLIGRRMLEAVRAEGHKARLPQNVTDEFRARSVKHCDYRKIRARQKKAQQLRAAGMTYRQIALSLGVSRFTVMNDFKARAA